MRVTRTVCFSVLTLATALSAGPALAAPPELLPQPDVGPLDPSAPVRNWLTYVPGREAFTGWECQPL